MTLWDFLSKIFDIFWPKNGDEKISRIYFLAIIMGLFVWTQKLDFDSYKDRLKSLEKTLPSINNSLILITSKMEQNGWFPEYGIYREEFKKRGLNDWYKARTNVISWIKNNHKNYRGNYKKYEEELVKYGGSLLYKMRIDTGSDYGEKILLQYKYLSMKTMGKFRIEIKSWLKTIYDEETLPEGWEYKIHEIFSNGEKVWLKFLKDIEKDISFNFNNSLNKSLTTKSIYQPKAIEPRKKYYIKKDSSGEKIFV